MPEHVHILVKPMQKKYSISAIRRDMKRPFAREMLRNICKDAPSTLKLLQSGQRNGKPCYRFWQQGLGYDRNLFTPAAISASIAYMHANPVSRGLCASTLDWEWSSARFYADGPDVPFDVDRCDTIVLVPESAKARRG